MATDNKGTYVVQVYSNFAPAELYPLLVRLEEDATVADCIGATLNKYLQRQPVIVLPSDDRAEYALCAAGGDGYPALGAVAFEMQATLRTISSLEFPFMLCLLYTPLRDQNPTSVQSSENVNAPANGTTQRSERVSGTHKTLSALERQAMAKELKERERIREENLRLIERRRLDKEREAYQHCESYEVMRREELRKEELAKENAELELTLKEQEEQMLREAAAEAARAATTETSSKAVLQRHRQEMERAVEEERTRALDVQKAREARLEQQRREREKMLEDKRQCLAKESNYRMSAALDDLIDSLHRNLALDCDSDQGRVAREQFDRKDVERMETDLRNIASLEERRHIPKIAERNFRVNISTSQLQHQAQKEESLTEIERQRDMDEQQKFQQWSVEQDKRKEALVAALELEYRSRTNQQQALLQ